MQVTATKSDSLMDRIIDRGMTLQKDLKNLNHTEAQNNDHAPQTLWANFSTPLSQEEC